MLLDSPILSEKITSIKNRVLCGRKTVFTVRTHVSEMKSLHLQHNTMPSGGRKFTCGSLRQDFELHAVSATVRYV